MSRIIFHPDLNAPLVPLADDPAWRPYVTAVGLYGQHILANGPNEFAEPPDHAEGVGPNYYQALKDSDWFRRIGLPIAVEWGAIKPEDLTGEEKAADVVTITNRMLDANGPVPSICMDEPYTTCKALNWPITSEDCTARVIRYCETIQHDAGIIAITLVESYPWFRSHDILSWTDQLRQAGVPLASLRIDCDWRSLKWNKSDRDDFSQLRKQCLSWGLPLDVIATPNNPQGNAKVFVDTATSWVESLPERLGGWPDVIVVQSWEGKNCPPLVPPSDPYSLSALKDTCVRLSGGS
jgi:hypothetical protein